MTDRDPFAPVTRRRLPRLRPAVLAMVFVGGCVGGAARYAVTVHWPAAASAVPWSTLAVNVAGTFALAFMLVVVADLMGPSRYVRPLLGTGFCGAFTTFSAMVVSADHLVAHGQPARAVLYLACSVAGGLLAGVAGILLGRWVTTNRSLDDTGGP